MAKVWYFAKCDKCMEVKKFYVSNPEVTYHYFKDETAEHQAWFAKHYGCELTLGWRDDHLDALWEEGYTNSDFD